MTVYVIYYILKYLSEILLKLIINNYWNIIFTYFEKILYHKNNEIWKKNVIYSIVLIPKYPKNRFGDII